jgi:DNA-directed RNA polymerase subunit RPC12/RpoP
MYDPHDESVCPQCGYRLLQRKETYDSFETEEMEPLDCPRCRQRKPFGFFYSE